VRARSYVDDERALIRLASEQGGFFTSKQAAAIGYTAPKRNYHVHTGNWVREHRGIFRLALHPLPSRPDLVFWWLWSRNRQDEPQAIYSHQTALSLHELTDVMPSRVHMSVPRDFRRSAPIPKALALQLADVPAAEVEIVDGVPVTKALRTLLDVASAEAVPIEDLRAAFAEAKRTGKITPSEIAEAESDPTRRDLLRKLKEGSADARKPKVLHSGRFPASARKTAQDNLPRGANRLSAPLPPSRL
jgi:predicted transcriptional regulator of viral defense system